MALRDYAIENEEDFYGQDFEKKSVVSVWVGLKDNSDDPEGLDVLQDLCGVGYYDLGLQEVNCFDFRSSEVAELLKGLSYSHSFAENVVDACSNKGIIKAKWILLQYEFAYDPKKVIREVSNEPVFIGVFEFDDG